MSGGREAMRSGALQISFENLGDEQPAQIAAKLLPLGGKWELAMC